MCSQERDTDVAEATGAVKAVTRNRTRAATWAGMTGNGTCAAKEETTCTGGGTATGTAGNETCTATSTKETGETGVRTKEGAANTTAPRKPITVRAAGQYSAARQGQWKAKNH